MKRFLILLWLLHVGAWADPEMRVFQLNNRPAAATIEIVRSVLTPQGTVFAEERLNKLIVRDTPEALQKVAELLTQIDQPAPQVSIKVTFQGANPGSGHQVGAGVVAPNRVGVVANAYSNNAAVHAQESLMVMSGEKGHIMVGQNLPYVQPYWTYANGLGLIPPGVVFQTVSTGFAVEPFVVGDNVRLKVTPWISYQGPNGPGQVEFAESASTLNVRSGEQVMLSSGSSNRSSSASAWGLILSNSASQQGQSMSIWLSAQVVPDYSQH